MSTDPSTNYPIKFSDKISLTVKEVIAATGIGRSSIYNYIKDKKLKAIKVGGKRLILQKDLTEFLETSRAH